MNKNKIFVELTSCTDVEITGNATDCTQVELYADNDKYFYNSKEQKEFIKHIESINSTDTTIDNRNNTPYSYKLTELIFFTVKKRIKQTDIVNFHIYNDKFTFSNSLLISKKVLDIFNQFTLPEHSITPCRIISIKDNSEWGEYYLLKLNSISDSLINYSKSAFWRFVMGGQYPQIKNREEYNTICLFHAWCTICLSETLTYDIISLKASIFINEKLYNALKVANIIGLSASKSELFFEENEDTKFNFTYPYIFSIDDYKEANTVQVSLGVGYNNSSKKFSFGDQSRFPNNSMFEIYDAGIGIDRIGYIDNKLAYIDIFESDDYKTILSKFEMELFIDTTFLYLQKNYKSIQTKNKVHIYFPELCMIFSCFSKVKDSRCKRVTIFDKSVTTFIETKKLKLI